MGLYIAGEGTGHSLSGSYHSLHNNARYLAYVYCGLPDNIGNGKDAFAAIMMFPYFESNFDNMQRFLFAIQRSGYFFPNLLMHSDCEGTYTKNGKNSPCYEKLDGGNSINLLEELELLCNDNDLINHKSERIRNALDYTIKFRDLVKDEIQNGSGTIEFC